MATYLNGVLVPVAPAAHEGTHVSGGSDEIDSALVLAAMADLTTDKVWEGVAGRPAEVDPPSGLTFTELVGGQDHQVTNDNVWEDWNISGIIPAGSKSALIGIGAAHTAVAAQEVGARKNGTALARKDLIYRVDNATVRWNLMLLTEVDANRVIELWVATGQKALFYFHVLGYWS